MSLFFSLISALQELKTHPTPGASDALQFLFSLLFFFFAGKIKEDIAWIG